MKKTIKRIIIMLVLLLLLTISLISNRNYLTLEIKVKDFLATIITSKKNNLPNQTENYILQKNLNNSLKQEIKELKELLNLNSTLSEYTTINATIISRNDLYWFNTVIIDKGKKDGLKKNMAVITQNGLIGKISKTTKKTSEIKLITTNDITYKTSVMIQLEEKTQYAILNGYDQENDLLKITAIDKNINIPKDSIVITSGLGQMPKGIYIGKVVKTEIDKYNLSQIVYVKPKQEFSNINYVTILKEK